MTSQVLDNEAVNRQIKQCLSKILPHSLFRIKMKEVKSEYQIETDRSRLSTA
ncbi:MAG: hypothetical protein ABFD49_08790 [Armatimonadota bacterium]|nr:hypothetical protein [bacterium]